MTKIKLLAILLAFMAGGFMNVADSKAQESVEKTEYQLRKEKMQKRYDAMKKRRALKGEKEFVGSLKLKSRKELLKDQENFSPERKARIEEIKRRKAKRMAEHAKFVEEKQKRKEILLKRKQERELNKTAQI